ncbi:MAG: glycosyltransferase [Planctomycetes bacterium]|nr:glycosyltransferase [Planctomycetota bacterium]
MTEPGERPAIAASPISVLLFAHALSTETDASVQAWRQHLDTLKRDYEIILIQETRSEVPPADAAPATRVFTYERTLGFRDAVNEAIGAARHPLVAFCPADRQYRPSDLNVLLQSIDKVDLVAGYRAGGQAPPWRVLLDTVMGLGSRLLIGLPLEPRVCWLGSAGWGRRWIARWIFGVRVMDPECPFRLARREIFQRLQVQSGGPFVQVEMLAKANFLSCLLTEEPVTWTPPADPQHDAIPFSQDARLLFRSPEFGSSQNHAIQNHLDS